LKTLVDKFKEIEEWGYGWKEGKIHVGC
jgi:hypothetical protein